MYADAFTVHNVTPMDFYRLGAGMIGVPMQVDEVTPVGSPSEKSNILPPPPPTPLCIEAEQAIATATAEIDAKGPDYRAKCVTMAEEVSKALEADKEYKAKCIARAKEARQAVASAHLVGAKPRRIVEETDEELEDVQGEMSAAQLTPRSNGKQHFVQRPELDMTMFSGKTVLCWDTETAGLGKPAICQLAYVLVSADGTHSMYDKIWKMPDGVYMSKDATKIHGITADKCKLGASPGSELIAFWNLVQQVLAEGGVVVGHNIQFDCRAFNFTSEKWGLTHTLEHGHMLDTMKESKPHSTLTTVKGYRKAFKNDELYRELFGSFPAWARLHNAMDDVHVSILNYQEGKRKGWW
jgi:DNA polymerase III epsilon subunit-like protein